MLTMLLATFFLCKRRTASEVRISDWSSDVCSSDLPDDLAHLAPDQQGGRFNVSVFNAPAREFFMSLAEDTPYNIIVHPKVDGSVTLQLKSVNLDELLALVRTTYGYEYQKTEMTYVILPTQLQNSMFEVAYLNINR